METKVTENGQAKVNTVKADKTPKFVAGNPINEVSKKGEEATTAETKPHATPEAPKIEPTKSEIKSHFQFEKAALNLGSSK